MRSMTGYGAAEAKRGDMRISVEIKSVNQRYFDIRILAPREYAPYEGELRRRIASVIARGRVEVFIGRRSARPGGAVVLRKDLAAAYVRAWRQLKREFGLAGDVELALLRERPELFAGSEHDGEPELEIKLVRRTLARALQAHSRDRQREGSYLKRDMQARRRALLGLVRAMKARSKKLAPRLRHRLEQRLAALLTARSVDPVRLAQEVAILTERADVTEELVRLTTHLDSLGRLLTGTGPVGKAVDFLLQEIHRELNTIASKAADVEVTNMVLQGKAETEKLREQVQNVE